MIRDKEVAEVKAFLMDRNHKHISIVFGGTTHVCEAMAIIARCIGADFTIYQRLISLKLAAETMTGEQIAHRLLLTLAVTFQIDSPHLVTIMHDRASVNDVAMRTIKPLYPQVMDVGCFSHTLDNVGRAIGGDTLKGFVMDWITLFSHSPKSRLQWESTDRR